MAVGQALGRTRSGGDVPIFDPNDEQIDQL